MQQQWWQGSSSDVLCARESSSDMCVVGGVGWGWGERVLCEAMVSAAQWAHGVSRAQHLTVLQHQTGRCCGWCLQGCWVEPAKVCSALLLQVPPTCESGGTKDGDISAAPCRGHDSLLLCCSIVAGLQLATYSVFISSLYMFCAVSQLPARPELIWDHSAICTDTASLSKGATQQAPNEPTQQA
jgi:hypothetical protein